MSPVLRTHNGFGDAIYQRPVIEAMCDARPDEFLTLACAWPELYGDLPVRFVPAVSPLIWARKNMAEQPLVRWAHAERKEPWRDLRISHMRGRLTNVSMLDLMAERAGVRVNAFTLPPLPPPPTLNDEFYTTARIAVIRPVTVRPDWPHSARNPLAEYVVMAAEMLRAAGYHVVSVACITRSEPYLGEPPFAHTRFDKGELGPLELLALTKAASLVVTGPNWAVPAALATGTPLVVIAGGAGGTNGPVALVPSWYRGRVSWIKPKNFCMCAVRRHGCMKEIPDFRRQFEARLETAALALP